MPKGLNIIKNANVGLNEARGGCRDDAAARSRSLPVRHRRLPQVAEVWRRGSVIGSWLLDLTAGALRQDPDAGEFRKAGSRIPAKAAGRCRPRSTKACPRR